MPRIPSTWKRAGVNGGRLAKSREEQPETTEPRPRKASTQEKRKAGERSETTVPEWKVATAHGSPTTFSPIGFSKDIKFEKRPRIVGPPYCPKPRSQCDRRSPICRQRRSAPDAVIKSSASTIRMVAPAGAGKTQNHINRVLYRVQRP